jgi:hypothetical protein
MRIEPKRTKDEYFERVKKEVPAGYLADRAHGMGVIQSPTIATNGGEPTFAAVASHGRTNEEDRRSDCGNSGCFPDERQMTRASRKWTVSPDLSFPPSFKEKRERKIGLPLSAPRREVRFEQTCRRRQILRRARFFPIRPLRCPWQGDDRQYRRGVRQSPSCSRTGTRTTGPRQ